MADSRRTTTHHSLQPANDRNQMHVHEYTPWHLVKTIHPKPDHGDNIFLCNESICNILHLAVLTMDDSNYWLNFDIGKKNKIHHLVQLERAC